MNIKIVLENSSGILDESEPCCVDDETDVREEVEALMRDQDWALAPGDVIRIVEVA